MNENVGTEKEKSAPDKDVQGISKQLISTTKLIRKKSRNLSSAVVNSY